jgi:endonuclease G
MFQIPSLRPETRYGFPSSDHLLFNRQYVVGYSYLFAQPRWALEIIDPANSRVEVPDRIDSFRPDLRIPETFRAGLCDFRGSGYDRGHLIASADRRSSGTLNSETFLLSNMCPQHPNLNRKAWRILEEKVRILSKQEDIVEVYAICGPLFNIGKAIQVIGVDPDDKCDVTIPIPHEFFKSIIAEELRGRLHFWSFILPNEDCLDGLSQYQVSTLEAEMRAGLMLWDRLTGEVVNRLKSKTSDLWFDD